MRETPRERVLAFTLARKLLARGQRVLVGVGGGFRSLGLMAFLAEARDDLALAEVAVASIEPTFDEDSDAAEVLADVGRLARALGLNFYAARPAPTHGRRVDISSELSRIARNHGFDRVALGHTRDDDAVRVLCELCRGGIDRVRGFSPRFKGGGVRPFLVLSDAEAARFVPAEAQGWIPTLSVAAVPEEDRTRHEILPRLRVVFPGVEAHLQELGRRARTRRRLRASHPQWARG